LENARQLETKRNTARINSRFNTNCVPQRKRLVIEKPPGGLLSSSPSESDPSDAAAFAILRTIILTFVFAGLSRKKKAIEAKAVEARAILGHSSAWFAE
jgi:hypothetical protein